MHGTLCSGMSLKCADHTSFVDQAKPGKHDVNVPDPFGKSGGSEASLGVKILDAADANSAPDDFKNIAQVSDDYTSRH